MIESAFKRHRRELGVGIKAPQKSIHILIKFLKGYGKTFFQKVFLIILILNNLSRTQTIQKRRITHGSYEENNKSGRG